MQSRSSVSVYKGARKRDTISSCDDVHFVESHWPCNDIAILSADLEHDTDGINGAGAGMGSAASPPSESLTQPLEALPPPERSKRARTSLVKDVSRANCGPECINRQSYVHCDEKTCPCGSFCTNR